MSPRPRAADARVPPKTPGCRDVVRRCGIIGVSTQESDANLEIYEGLLMLQHRGQDSAGIVTTDWDRFHEHRGNGLVKDVFTSQAVLDKLPGVCFGGGRGCFGRGRVEFRA